MPIDSISCLPRSLCMLLYENCSGTSPRRHLSTKIVESRESSIKYCHLAVNSSQRGTIFKHRGSEQPNLHHHTSHRAYRRPPQNHCTETMLVPCRSLSRKLKHGAMNTYPAFVTWSSLVWCLALSISSNDRGRHSLVSRGKCRGTFYSARVSITFLSLGLIFCSFVWA